MLGWTLTSGIVVAGGGEDHIVIGNFHNDANTATVPGPGTNCPSSPWKRTKTQANSWGAVEHLQR